MEACNSYENSEVPSSNFEKRCRCCGKGYVKRGNLENHEIKCFSNTGSCEDREEERNVEGESSASCSKCKMPIKSLGGRNRNSKHCSDCLEKVKKNSKKSQCRLCPQIQFSSEEEYLYHLTEVHKGKDRDYFMCSDCGKQFKTRGELTHHNNSKCGTIKLYQCKVCGQELMTAGSLHNHMLLHTKERCCMCGYCGKLFLTAGQLKVHERAHTQEKAFTCNVCGKGFCHRQSLITHSTLHTGIKPYQCDNCGHSFSCVGNLIKHRRMHADTCGATPLTTHRVNNPATKLKVKLNTPENSKLTRNRKEKEVREKVEAYRERLKTARNDVDEEDKLSEEDCLISSIIDAADLDEFSSTGFEMKDEYLSSNEAEVTSAGYDDVGRSEDEELSKDETNAKEGVDEMEDVKAENSSDSDLDDVFDKQTTVDTKRTTSQISISDEDVKEFAKNRKSDGRNGMTCKYCSKSYSNARWLLRHEKEHEKKSDGAVSDGSYKCSCCKANFGTKEACKDHQKAMHTNLLTCYSCEKVFSNLDSLRSHERIFHKGIPRKVYTYVCDKCGLQFKQKTYLAHHERNNCGTDPVFACHVCHKGFNSVHTCRSHMRIHDPKKRFLCKFCGKDFRWKGQLKIHERSHTGEKPFKCLYCPKAFAYRESLMTHSSLHTGIKPHLCRACGSRFSCIGNLIKHRSTHASTCGAWHNKNQEAF